MHEALNEPQRRFLLTLREGRPELVEMLAGPPRPLAMHQRLRLIARLEYLADEGQRTGYAEVAGQAALLLHALHKGEQPDAVALLDAALIALTFIDGRPAKQAPLYAVPPRLLIADDDRIVREMMKQLFADTTELYIAQDGLEAYAMLQQCRPHLAILDDFMPGMTGLRLVEKMRETPDLVGIHVFMLTASDRERDEARARASGVSEYILKPFHPGRLAECVHNTLKKML